jgi:hypothetical protein
MKHLGLLATTQRGPRYRDRVAVQPVYDRIGAQYREGRREDPRIAAAILAALGGAAPVVNVGAGAACVGSASIWTAATGTAGGGICSG